MIRYQSTVLFVENIGRSKRFYTSVLGFKVEMDSGLVVYLNNNIALWQIPDGHPIADRSGTDSATMNTNRFELYFETEDLESIDNNLREKSVIFFQKLHEEPWGQKTIRFFDPDGHLIEIGETLYGFISRMKRNGMKLEQISAKTGMKTEDISKVLDSPE